MKKHSVRSNQVIRVISFNIHKGFSTGNRKFTLKELKKAIHVLQPDVICLQEVQESHVRHKKHFPDLDDFSQIKYLAEGLWPHLVYGKNAIYTEGHHGNAILSRYPIEFWENEDISRSKIERRGLLHAVLRVPHCEDPFHVICSHLGLFETDRSHQVRSLWKRIESMVPHEQPVIVAGDFNDWREKVSSQLHKHVGLNEAFVKLNGCHAKTFPAWMPVFRLDRVYFRGVDLKKAMCLQDDLWSKISDHLALFCEFSI